MSRPVIEFGDSYEVPVSIASTTTTDTASDATGKKKGRTVTLTAEDMQKRKNDVKARTTLLLSLPDEHQLRFTEGSETLEQTFNRLQVIIGQLQFIDVEIEHDDLNQKFLTSLAPEWLMHTILWRNRSDLDTISLDDLYNHLKVYESEVQKKSKPNSHNMAFISLTKHSRGNEDVNTASVSTASTNVPTASANVGVASISQDTACAYIAFQSSGSQIKFEDINQIDEDDIALRSQDRGRRDNYRQGSKVEEKSPKALMTIDGVGWDWSYMANDEENHTLVADKEALSEFALMANTSAESKVFDNSLCSKDCKKNTDSLNRYNAVPPPAQIYSSPKKDLSWTGLPEFKDDTVTNYSRPAPTIESSLDDAENSNPFVTEEASPNTITPKSFIKFVKANDSPTKSKIDKAEKAKKSPVKKRVKQGTSRSQNNTHKIFTPRPAVHKPYRPPMRPMRSNMNVPRTILMTEAIGTVAALGGCKIIGKGAIKTGKLEFENVYFMKYLKYNLFSVSQICDNKNSILFTDSECIVLGQNFKLSDDDNVLLRTPRQHNMYSIALNNIVPHKDLTCLVAKASTDECMLWHRRLDNLGKFEAKGDEGYFIGYSMSSKAFRIFNKRTTSVEENLHVEFLENKAIEKGTGPNWLFDIDSLTKSMNYVPVDTGTNSTNPLGTKDAASQKVKKDVSSLRYIAFPNWVHDALLESSSSKPEDDCSTDFPESSGNCNPTATSTNPLADKMESLMLETPIPTVSSPVPTACLNDSPEPSNILGVITNSVDSDGVKADVSNMKTTITTSPTPTLRIHKDHPKSQIIGPVDTPIQTRNKFKKTLVDCPKGVRPIGTKWVLKNKKDERGIVIRNKARLVAQGHTQEEGINYDEVFAPVARIEAIRLFLAFASFMGFTVYQMDVKSAFLYGTIDEEVYVMQPPGFQDPEFPARVYKVEKAMYGLHQAPRAWYGTLSKYLLTNGFQKGDILKKFRYLDVRSSNTPMDKENPWGKDRTGKDVDLRLYRSMIGSLMYLTASRPDIMFAIRACARHQVTPKECHLYAVKRIFRYLKGHPKLGLWYPKESPFDLVAYSDSDYGGATQDRKSTTEGCQFLGRRLISWQCKKQTIVATSTTEAEYVAAASCCGQVLWI
nr:hypothetical protein [Tanacetum cinerariifolium]